MTKSVLPGAKVAKRINERLPKAAVAKTADKLSVPVKKAAAKKAAPKVDPLAKSVAPKNDPMAKSAQPAFDPLATSAPAGFKETLDKEATKRKAVKAKKVAAPATTTDVPDPAAKVATQLTAKRTTRKAVTKEVASKKSAPARLKLRGQIPDDPASVKQAPAKKVELSPKTMQAIEQAATALDEKKPVAKKPAASKTTSAKQVEKHKQQAVKNVETSIITAKALLEKFDNTVKEIRAAGGHFTGTVQLNGLVFAYEEKKKTVRKPKLSREALREDITTRARALIAEAKKHDLVLVAQIEDSSEPQVKVYETK